MKNSLKKAFFGILALSMTLTMGNGVTTFAETEEPTVAAAPADTDSDSEVTTITTNPITLKVGVSSESTSGLIPKLVADKDESLKGGFSSGIKIDADGTPVYGQYDSEFFELKEFIGIIDETTGKQYAQGYYTPAEANAFINAWRANKDTGVSFAEEGTGDAYVHLCPKKTGSTEIISNYYDPNTEKNYTVKVPVNIVDSSEDERDKAPTWEEACAMKPGKTEDVKKDDTTDAKPDEGKKDDTTDSSKPKPIEIYTDPITLKVGVSAEINIEQLVGAKYESLKGGYTEGIREYAGTTYGSYDPDFFVLKGYVIVLDETAGKKLVEAYYSFEEERALEKACAEHADAGINFAAEGNGDGFSQIIPKKTGSTVLTAAPYTVNGQEYTVKIPVNIVESSEEEREKKAPTWEELYEMKFGKTYGTVVKTGGTDDAAATASTSAAGSSQVSFTDTNKVLPEGAKLTSTKLESGTAYDAAIAAVKAAKTSSQTAVYAFDLTDASNAAIHELGGMIAVTVPAPFTVEADHELHVYRLNETDNSLIACDVTVNADGTVTFLTNHFSTYIFTSEPKAATAQTPQNVNPTSPGTGDKTNVYVWLYVIASLLFIGLIGVIIKEKRA
ncbi:hypothetical protein FYJ75_11440 [Roseburia sp. MUC/MUC-530-WT-4D]|uniref:Gram-positive pilin subunit D1 N-terminal domain-containing protein n=1 Tax=Roseburia porci TaxID=2605790 RepID=A0A6L5YUK1_9FIRM|nr:hypothetical protein [Roseburia porci]MST75622.1 hypothetical protein [Roseburia porci]